MYVQITEEEVRTLLMEYIEMKTGKRVNPNSITITGSLESDKWKEDRIVHLHASADIG